MEELTEGLNNLQISKLELFQNENNVDVLNFKNFGTPCTIICRVCKREHLLVKPCNYRRRKTKCCENVKINIQKMDDLEIKQDNTQNVTQETTVQKTTVQKIQELEEELNVTLNNYVDMNTKILIVCRTCQKEHNISPRGYRKRNIRCKCQDSKKFREPTERKKINGRDPSVNFELVKSNIETVCKNKNGVCLNIDEYINSETKLRFKCNICQCEWQAKGYLIYGKKQSWCPNCVTSKDSEKRCRAILEQIFPDYKFPSTRPSWLKNDNGATLELDCFNEDLKLALERNGEQHERMVPFFHKPTDITNMTEEEILIKSNEKFNNQIKRDQLKIKLCEKKGINLIIVDETVIRKGIPHVKKFIYEQCMKINLETNPILPDEFWLETQFLDIQNYKKAVEFKNQLLDCITQNAIGYRLQDPNIVIAGFRFKFILICPNNHEYETYICNFVNNNRRCGECAINRRKTTINTIKESIHHHYGSDNVEIPDQIYQNAKTKLELICKKCNNVVFQRTFTSIQRSMNNNNPIHPKCPSANKK